MGCCYKTKQKCAEGEGNDVGKGDGRGDGRENVRPTDSGGQRVMRQGGETVGTVETVATG